MRRSESTRNRVGCSIHCGAMTAREELVAHFCSVAPVGVRSQKSRPSHIRGMHYAVTDSTFVQWLGAVGASI